MNRVVNALSSDGHERFEMLLRSTQSYAIESEPGARYVEPLGLVMADNGRTRIA
jgi:hypothetical protein